ncbi:cyclophane-forming radical SAM peptide maturase AmcB [Actinocorallia sp. A-T 12471]|uniref:cyclophane-forming radical SAM peptide maturase AmcB n=1 Tax=Actinocorallia sp. A-T 12471 TaxID=3089813 RepID=UPI0029CEEB9D|nr:cyclophane-forming radical SAM peptide maturase AmcB [Actinocorallia sp. A-T 12471]MDX6744139.1 cyclophane-forming radical SAM peptide maturase AmcB [Actinocorallia sp. A-T 12471]
MDTSARTRRMRFDERIGRSFRTVILQPTSLCNLDCDYCYLPGRKKRYEILPTVVKAAAASIAEQNDPEPVGVVWHGGEPTALPIATFRQRVLAFEDLRIAGLIEHSIQTNATLLTEQWCALFRTYRFQVGVSVDGPEAANVNRVDRAGRPAFEKIMRCIGVLRDHEIPFSVICVVSPETVGDPGGLMEFFAGLGCTQVGFNIEELEGVNDSRDVVDTGLAEAFWAGVIAAHHRFPDLRVREIDQLAAYLNKARTGRKEEWTGVKHDPIPTIAWNGDLVLMSPELLGIDAPEHRGFVVGNVLKESLSAILRRAHDVPYIAELLDGLDGCESTCAFWDFCRGAHAGNRYFEHGSFAATETAHCRNTRQALVTAFAAATAVIQPKEK